MEIKMLNNKLVTLEMLRNSDFVTYVCKTDCITKLIYIYYTVKGSFWFMLLCNLNL